MQDQAILHEELKCLRGIFAGFSKWHCFTVVTYKTIAKWFSKQDSVIHARIWDVARLSESVKIHSPAARVFLRFPKVSRHPSCMDHAILHGKPFGIPLMTVQTNHTKLYYNYYTSGKLLTLKFKFQVNLPHPPPPPQLQMLRYVPVFGYSLQGRRI